MRKALIVAFLLAACQPIGTDEPEIVARWDHRSEAAQWNDAMMTALMTHGAPMLALTPQDAHEFCPGYESGDETARAAFWVAFFSGLARFESGWRPEAAGAGGRYQGLLQISPATARFHGCDLSAPGGLYDGATNLTCATRVAARAVQRDGVVASGRGGVAADWPPMRDASKRAEVAAFTRSIPACQSQQG